MNERSSRGGPLAVGDRVRIVASASPYTGCRGSVAEPPVPVPKADAGEPLGYYVSIDGEQGRARPFLTGELERVRVARVRPPEPSAPRRQEPGSGRR